MSEWLNEIDRDREIHWIIWLVLGYGTMSKLIENGNYGMNKKKIVIHNNNKDTNCMYWWQIHITYINGKNKYGKLGWKKMTVIKT